MNKRFVDPTAANVESKLIETKSSIQRKDAIDEPHLFGVECRL